MRNTCISVPVASTGAYTVSLATCRVRAHLISSLPPPSPSPLPPQLAQLREEMELAHCQQLEVLRTELEEQQRNKVEKNCIRTL